MMTAICNQLGLFIEREQLEQQFRQSQKLEAIGRLAGGISHDFNNLLTSIMGYAHLIEGQLTKHETLHRNAQQIQKTSHRAASLIQQLLTLSQSQVMKPELCDMNQVICDIQPMLARLLTESIEVKMDLMKSTKFVMADRTQIEQVLVNLAVNARDAMEEEGGPLGIETRLVQLNAHDAKVLGLKPGQFIQLNISDTGHGMNETVKRHLFEPFFTTKEVGKGSGLGLATVYGIVTQSGGNIDVHSNLDEGTTFSVYLPIVNAKPDVSIQEYKMQDEEIFDHPDETILILDDAIEIREIMQTILSSEGYTVFEENDGHDALHLLEKHHENIDLIISDIYMPKMMGDVFINEVNKNYPEIKILLISGITAEIQKGTNKIFQAYPFMAKPFPPEALLEKVRQVLKPSDPEHDVKNK